MGLALRSGKKTVRAVARRAADETALFVETVGDDVGLARVAGEWNGLFAAVERPSPCASHAWASAWWDVYGRNPRGVGVETGLAVFLFRNAEGALVGVAPFVEDRPSGLLDVRRLRPLGFAWQCGVFDMTEEPSLLIPDAWRERVMDALVLELRAGLEAGRWDAACLRTHGAPLRPALAPLGDCAFLKTDSRSGSDYAQMPSTWADYRKSMTRSMRDNLPYYPRLLTRDGHDWSVRLLRAPGEMAEAAARLAELHRARSASDKGCFHIAHIHGPVQEAFLSRLLQGLAATGQATVAELVVGGDVVASQAFVESGDTLTVSYSGYREAWYRYSPVFVLDAVVFKDALERGVQRIDFLRGSAPWKTRWLAEPGPRLHRAVLVSRRPESLLRYGVFLTGRTARRNVVDRAPILARRLAMGLRNCRTVLERALVPAIPLAGRLTMRLAPTAHWALAQAPLHHR